MSPRVGPILLAMGSVATRISGNGTMADILVLAALGTLTLALQRATPLQAAARSVRSCNLLTPPAANEPHPAA